MTFISACSTVVLYSTCCRGSKIVVLGHLAVESGPAGGTRGRLSGIGTESSSDGSTGSGRATGLKEGRCRFSNGARPGAQPASPSAGRRRAAGAQQQTAGSTRPRGPKACIYTLATITARAFARRATWDVKGLAPPLYSTPLGFGYGCSTASMLSARLRLRVEGMAQHHEEHRMAGRGEHCGSMRPQGPHLVHLPVPDDGDCHGQAIIIIIIIIDGSGPPSTN